MANQRQCVLMSSEYISPEEFKVLVSGLLYCYEFAPVPIHCSLARSAAEVVLSAMKVKEISCAFNFHCDPRIKGNAALDNTMLSAGQAMALSESSNIKLINAGSAPLDDAEDEAAFNTRIQNLLLQELPQYAIVVTTSQYLAKYLGAMGLESDPVPRIAIVAYDQDTKAIAVSWKQGSLDELRATLVERKRLLDNVPEPPKLQVEQPPEEVKAGPPAVFPNAASAYRPQAGSTSPQQPGPVFSQPNAAPGKSQAGPMFNRQLGTAANPLQPAPMQNPQQSGAVPGHWKPPVLIPSSAGTTASQTQHKPPFAPPPSAGPSVQFKPSSMQDPSRPGAPFGASKPDQAFPPQSGSAPTQLQPTPPVIRQQAGTSASQSHLSTAHIPPQPDTAHIPSKPEAASDTELEQLTAQLRKDLAPMIQGPVPPRENPVEQLLFDLAFAFRASVQKIDELKAQLHTEQEQANIKEEAFKQQREEMFTEQKKLRDALEAQKNLLETWQKDTEGRVRALEERPLPRESVIEVVPKGNPAVAVASDIPQKMMPEEAKVPESKGEHPQVMEQQPTTPLSITVRVTEYGRRMAYVKTQEGSQCQGFICFTQEGRYIAYSPSAETFIGEQEFDTSTWPVPPGAYECYIMNAEGQALCNSFQFTENPVQQAAEDVYENCFLRTNLQNIVEVEAYVVGQKGANALETFKKLAAKWKNPSNDSLYPFMQALIGIDLSDESAARKVLEDQGYKF